MGMKTIRYTICLSRKQALDTIAESIKLIDVEPVAQIVRQDISGVCEKIFTRGYCEAQ